jgi:hypothetical protein
MSQISDNFENVKKRINDAAVRVGRSADEITLIAVSKTFSAQAVVEAILAGQRDFGENRVEEALPKFVSVNASLSNVRLSSPVRWHLIGHLQSRKAKDAINNFALIHSLDSVKLAQKLTSRHAPTPQPVLLQCNVSGEMSKDGFDLSNWRTDTAKREIFFERVASILAMPQLHVRGLMTIAPIVEAQDQARATFASLRELREALLKQFPSADWAHLSMGMSDDLEAAIAEGATMVRVGRAIFGNR